MLKPIKILFLTLLVSSAFMFSSVFAATISLPRTGQNACYDSSNQSAACASSGQDADKLAGVSWPTPRFTDDNNGTVTDNLTQLVWLKNANCFGANTWTSALASANTLASPACGLSDSSTAGQWRLPNRKELMSLIDISQSTPALSSGHPFVTVQSGNYWSSSNFSTNYAWYVDLIDGFVLTGSKAATTGSFFVWPVRDK